jgi:hypothetical protein
MRTWDFLVDRADLSRTQVRPATEPDAAALEAGEVLVEIERFSMTANNITYGVVGDQLGYWRFFPDAGEWGRIPVWGFARVVATRAEGVAQGLRLYGFWPMSTHFVTRMRVAGSGFVDASEHRAALPPAYNRYEIAPETPRDDYLALLRPLFTTSFLLDDYLAGIAPDATAVLSSASSRTALGLAWMLKARGAPGVALTSQRNRAFVEGLGLYSRTVTYDAVEAMEIAGQVAFVDMAGDASVRAAVHRRFDARLIHSAIVGSTHHEARGGSGDLPGPKPSFFFAPDRLVARRRDWGVDVLWERIDEAMSRFIDDSDWLHVERHHGPEALVRVYASVLSGTAGPDAGHVILP